MRRAIVVAAFPSPSLETALMLDIFKTICDVSKSLLDLDSRSFAFGSG